MIIGTVVCVVTLAKVHAVRNGYDFTGSARFAWSVAFIGLLALTSYGAGLPDLPESTMGAAAASAGTLAVSAVGISVIQLFAGDELLPRFVVGASILVLFPWFVVCWRLAQRDRARREQRDRIFLIGSLEDRAALEGDLRMGTELPATLVGHRLPASTAAGGGSDGVIADVIALHASVVVLSREAQADESVVHAAAALHERGIRIRTLSLFYEQWFGKLPLSELERVSLLYDISEVHRMSYSRVTRLFDVALAAVGVVALVVLLPVVAVGNLVGNRGPLFYRQPRVGKAGKEFSILKFRTMRPSAAGLPNEWTTEDDPRITPFGRMLRRTHIDEMPQMLNILRGDLSLVGPRPEQPHYVAELLEKLPFYGLRHLVTPGLTGWAQVKYGYAGTESDALEKLQYEFYYLRHQSLALDLKILLRTLRRVLLAAGR
jgi:lipopolysaccharide/colanic/teichoic acid biosynthesis glycosyltransferase